MKRTRPVRTKRPRPLDKNELERALGGADHDPGEGIDPMPLPS